MTADDKFGLGAGSLALGLAGGLILLAQLLPGNIFQLPANRCSPSRFSTAWSV